MKLPRPLPEELDRQFRLHVIKVLVIGISLIGGTVAAAMYVLRNWS